MPAHALQVVPLREKSKSHALVESTGFDCAVIRPLHMNKIETRVRDAYVSVPAVTPSHSLSLSRTHSPTQRANVRKANGEPGASCTSLDARSHTSQASAQSQGLAARPTRARTFHGLSAAPSRSSSRPDASRAEAGRTPPTSTPHGSEHDSGYGGGSSPHSQAKAEREQEDADPSWERIAKGLQGDTREYGRSDVPGSRLGAGLRRQSSLGVPAADAKVVTYPLPRAGGGAGHGEVGAPWGRQLTQPSPTGSYSTVSATQGEQTGLSLPSLPAIPGLASMTDAPARAVDMPALPTLPGGPPALPTGQVGAVHEASSDSSDSDSSGEVAEDDATRSGRVLRVLVAEDNKINQKVQACSAPWPRIASTPCADADALPLAAGGVPDAAADGHAGHGGGGRRRGGGRVAGGAAAGDAARQPLARLRRRVHGLPECVGVGVGVRVCGNGCEWPRGCA